MIKDLKNGLSGNPFNTTMPSSDSIIEAKGMRAGYTAQQKADKIWLNKERKLSVNMTDLSQRRSSRIPAWREGQEGATYGMIWFDIEESPSNGCGWGTSYSSNCQYLQELIQAAEAKGAHV